MIADFYDTFDETPDRGSDIPQEVLDVLSKELPSNFMYFRDENGRYKAGPKPECMTELMTLKVDIDQSFIEEYLKDIPRDKWPEYLYRMQLRVPVKNVRIGNEEKQIPLENIDENLLDTDTSVKMQEAYMYPEPFPPAKELEFETVEGEKITINIAQQPYASLEETLFTNINFPALQIRFLLADDYEHSKVTYTVNPKKAVTVSDALAAIHLFSGLYHGTVKIDGEKITEPVTGSSDLDMDQLNNMEDFWTIAKKLEEKLGVHFDPGAEFPMEDIVFFSQLNDCLLEEKEVEWEHPFDHFHVSGMTMKIGQYKDILGKEGGECVFQEGPIHATLLGAEFELYSHTRLSNIVITNIVWDDEKNTSGEIYVSDPVGGKWKLYRKYMMKE